MFSRSSLVVLLAAGSLLARPAHAEGTPPARQPAPLGAADPPAATSRTLNLVGTIVDPTGRPCAGVCVFPTSNPRLIAVTDATGSFRLQIPATAGTFYLQADYVGLGSRRVAIDSEHPQPVKIVLGE